MTSVELNSLSAGTLFYLPGHNNTLEERMFLGATPGHNSYLIAHVSVSEQGEYSPRKPFTVAAYELTGASTDRGTVLRTMLGYLEEDLKLIQKQIDAL